MGELTNLSKATLQVKSSDDYQNITSKTFDILSEYGVYDADDANGDVNIVKALVTAIYAKSTRTVTSAVIIGTSADIM